ncbi:MAG: hypothetical protein AAGI25_11875 [Bacteroidota bacterium]
MKRLIFYFSILLCFIVTTFSCQESEDATPIIEEIQTVELDGDAIESMMAKFDPMFDNVRARMEAPELISYEILADPETGVFTLLNFKEESYFPIDGIADANARTVYSIHCTKGEETIWTKECNNKSSCGSLVADCLELGGCTNVCKNPNGFTSIRNSDIILLESYGVSSNYINMIKTLPTINLSVGLSKNTISSVKLYKLIY